MQLAIDGGGIAACAAILTLCQGPLPSSLQITWGRPADCFANSPVVVLDGTAVALITQLTNALRFPPASHQLRRHLVAWANAPARVFERPALAVRWADLYQSLVAATEKTAGPRLRCLESSSRESDWTLRSQFHGHDGESIFRRFGGRITVSAEVPLKPGQDSGATCMEAVPGGWLHLAPVSERRAVVQATLPATHGADGQTLRDLLATSSHVARRVEREMTPAQVTGSAPGFRYPCHGERWLALGHGAAVYDPICGDGTAQSIRGGLLAGAVLSFIAQTEDPAAALQHYGKRIRASLATHLETCRLSYETACFGSAWQDELATIRQAPGELASSTEPFRFRLEGYRLVPVMPPPARSAQ